MLYHRPIFDNPPTFPTLALSCGFINNNGFDKPSIKSLPDVCIITLFELLSFFTILNVEPIY